MEKVLYLTTTNDEGGLSRASLEALKGARELVAALGEATLSAGLIGADVQPAANAIAECGADRVLGVSGDDYGVSRYSTDTAAAAALIQASGATVVIAPAGSRLNRCLPGVAQRVAASVWRGHLRD